MLLKKKKAVGTEQNWSVVLSAPAQPPHPEVLAHKISQVFGLSEPEAANIIESMPIVLIEGVSSNAAENIKKEIDQTGASVFITNEESVTRKCSKTLWPDPPDLSLFETVSGQHLSSVGSGSMKELEQPLDDSDPSQVGSDDQRCREDLAGAADLSNAEEQDPLSSQIRLYQEKLVSAQAANWQLEESLKDHVMKIQELRERAVQLEEKLQAIEKERSMSAGQTAQPEISIQNLTDENYRLKEQLQKAEENRLGSEEAAREQHSKHVRIEKEFLETHREQEDRIRSLQKELDDAAARLRQLQEDRNGLELTQGQIDEMLKEYQKEMKHLNEKNALILEQYAAIERTVADERYRRGEAEKALAGFDEAKARLEEAARSAEAEAKELRDKNQMLAEQYDALERAMADERSRRGETENALKLAQDRIAVFDEEKRLLSEKAQALEEGRLELEQLLKARQADLQGLQDRISGDESKMQLMEQRGRELAGRNEELLAENQSLAAALLEAKNQCGVLESQHHQSVREINDMFAGAQTELEKLRGRVKDLEEKLASREQDNDQMSKFLRERLHELNDCRAQYDKLMGQYRDLQTQFAQSKEHLD